MARIGIDARYLETEDTGLGRYSFNLLSHLLEIDRKNRYWVFLRKQYQGELPSSPHVTYTRVNIAPISLSSLFLMSWKVRRLHLDLWHAHFPVAPLFSGTPLVVTVHDLQPLRVPSLGDRRPLPLRLAYRLYYPLVYGMSLTLSSEIVAVSGATCGEIQDVFSVPRERIHVVHEALDSRFTDEPRARAVPEDLRFLLYVGPTLPHKNLEALLRGFAAVLEQPGTGDLCLVMAGRETRFEELWIRQARQLAIIHRIHRLGYVSRAALRDLYSRALALVHLSRHEGFGFTPLEAMHCGLPVIAAACASLPEVVGSAAILVDPEDAGQIAGAMVRILRDEPLRRNLARLGNLNLERFRWREAARQTLSLYQRVIEHAPSKR